MKLKVCGMKYIENIQQIAELKPDYLGFIFYERSKRNFEGIIPDIPKSIKKTGVFVNEHLEILVSLAQEYQLDAVQLHGDESPEYIRDLQYHFERSREINRTELMALSKKQQKRFQREKAGQKIEIIKVFGIKEEFDFSILEDYVELVDYFLFDTKGKERGGNGVKFNWEILKGYPYQKPFFLSGGITPNDAMEIEKIRNTGLPIHAVDINSQFESNPGMKNIKEVKDFKNKIMSK